MPTFNFHVDQLEVETKEEGEPPEEVIVRNRDGRGSDLEFSAEVQGGGGTPDLDPSPTPEAGTDQPQSTLGFLSEPLNLTLDSPSSLDQCKEQIDSARDAKKMTITTVFLSRTGDEQALRVKFTTNMRKPTIEEGVTERVPVQVYLYNNSCSQTALFPKTSDVRAFNILLVGGSASPSVSFRDPRSWWSPLKELVEWGVHIRRPPEDWRSFAGHLIVSSENHSQAVPGTLPLQLISRPRGYEAFYHISILVLAAIWILIVGVHSYRRLGKDARKVHVSRRQQWLNEELPFEFKAGWASNLTTTGAVLGTLLSASVLPSDTVLMSKAQYVSLNVLFGLVLLFAAVWHNQGQTGTSFLWAYAFTLGAGIGELITTLLILLEVGYQESMPREVVHIVQFVLLPVAGWVTWTATNKAITKIETPRAKGGLV